MEVTLIVPTGGMRRTRGCQVHPLLRSRTEVCNGEEGPTGDPWTAGGTLPNGETETGVWAFNITAGAGEVYAPISFPIPLAAIT